MSSVSGVGSLTSSMINGYGGLASGLDTQELIEGMTIGTQSKIDSKYQDIQTEEWKQESLRLIIDSFNEFQSKYMSYSSSSNLLSSSLYAPNNITPMGDNADKVSVSGSGASAAGFSIIGVSQLAKNAQFISSGVSSSELATGTFDSNLTAAADVSKVEGDKIYFELAGERYTVELEKGKDYSSLDKVKDAINEALGEITAAGGTLADQIEAGISADGNITFQSVDGNETKITGGTGNILTDLGILAEGEELTEPIDFSDATYEAANAASLIEERTVADAIKGTSMTFNYNGKNATIKFEETYATMGDMVADMQAQLDEAYGAGRVKVNFTDDGANSSISIMTMVPGESGGTEDKSSELKLVSGSGFLVGEESFFNMQIGESNRANLTTNLKDSGLSNVTDALSTGDLIISNGSGKELNLSEEFGFSADTTSVNDIIKAINDSDLGIEVSYQAQTDSFIVKSTEEGANGTIDLGGNVAEMLFGTGYTVTEGQDAQIQIQYEGMDSPVTLTRLSNTFDIDGMSITANEVFTDGEAIEFKAEVDTEETIEAVKGMIDDYNALIALVNAETSEKPNNDYAPLTDAQKDEMTENEIKLWEEKANAGLLFNDSDLKALADELRFALPASMTQAFEEIGITVSTNYKDNGKLVFDEDKFEEALNADPDNVKELLSADSLTTSAGTSAGAGFMVNVEAIYEKYAEVTGADKGILVDRAGSELAPTSMLENSLQKMIDDMEDEIDRLKDTLQMEVDRYTSEFTALETLIAEMNSQSSYISSMFTA